MKQFAFATYCLSLFLYCLPSVANAATRSSTVRVTVKLPSSGVDQVNAISNRGRVFRGTLSGNSVRINIPTSSISGTSFYAVNGGRLVGPVLAPSRTKGLIFLGKKLTSPTGQSITNLRLTLKVPVAEKSYAELQRAPQGKVFNKSLKYTPSNIPQYGLNSSSSAGANALVRTTAVRGDSDGDGVVDRLDTDVDGDGINNLADSSSVSSSSLSALDGESIDVPFTALYLGVSDAVNWHLNGGLDASTIDAVIGGENKFSVAFFFAIPPGSGTTITGGHVVCGSSLTYCKPTDGSGTGTGVYSGFSEGNQSLPGRLWSSIDTDGKEYSLENFSVGSSSDSVYAASIQPRVGTSAFRPGDNYRVDFTNSRGAVVSSTTLTLPPYFVTVPVIRSYNTTSNDAGGDTLLDHTDPFAPGTSNGNPIVLSNSGDFSGKLRVNLFRLQRMAVGSESSNGFMDVGHLNYGVLIENNSAEYSCGELYSSLSSTLSETSSQGTGGSFRSSDGAKLWPLVDSSDDYEPSNASDSTSIGNNTVSFTIDLSACRARNGLSPGVHNVNIFAAGADTGHGANRAAQRFAVNIP